MASRAFFTAMIIVVAVAPAMAVDYMVGDDKGWTLKGVNYTVWAAGKDFRVGDTLMFMYNEGDHNVYKVSGTDFKQCNASNSLGGPLTSGKDVVTLTSTGKKWYICGKKNHCSQGMRLVISVSDALAPAPAPVPGTPDTPNSASKIVKTSGWMLAVAAAYRMIVA